MDQRAKPRHCDPRAEDDLSVGRKEALLVFGLSIFRRVEEGGKFSTCEGIVNKPQPFLSSLGVVHGDVAGERTAGRRDGGTVRGCKGRDKGGMTPKRMASDL